MRTVNALFKYDSFNSEERMLRKKKFMSLSIASVSNVASKYNFICNIVFLCFLLLSGGVDRELSELGKNRLVGLLVLIYRNPN